MSAITAGNPAARLHEIVTRAGQAINEASETAGDSPAWVVWASVLGSGNTDPRAAIREFAKVMDLLEQLVAWIPAVGEAEREDPWNIGPAAAALSQFLPRHFLSATVDEAKGDLGEKLSINLRAAAGAIWRLGAREGLPDSTEGLPDEDAIQTLDAQLGDLEAEIRSDDSLPHEAKAFALRHISFLRQALADVEYYGIERLRDAVTGYFGELVLGFGLQENAIVTFGKSSKFRTLTNWVRDVGAVVSTSRTLIQVGTGERMQGIVDAIKAIGPG